jgi:hypothetical protein
MGFLGKNCSAFRMTFRLQFVKTRDWLRLIVKLHFFTALFVLIEARFVSEKSREPPPDARTSMLGCGIAQLFLSA